MEERGAGRDKRTTVSVGRQKRKGENRNGSGRSVRGDWQPLAPMSRLP